MFDRIRSLWVAGNPSVEAAEARQLVQLVETLTKSPVEKIGNDFQSFVRRGYLNNGIVYGCITSRLVLFAQGVFKLENRRDKTVRDLPPRLQILNEPWPGGSTAEMLARIEQDTSLAGNWYLLQAEPDQWQRLRPDWVDIVLDPQGRERIGYLYHRGGRSQDIAGLPLTLDQVIHGSPYPDPLAAFRGTSWIMSVTGEVESDTAMTRHKGQFFNNAAPQPLHAKILTPTGWTTMGQLNIGDLIIGGDGQPHPVVGVYPQGDLDVYRVSFNDGTWAETTLNHVWEVTNIYDRQRGVVRHMTLGQLVEYGFRFPSGAARWAIPLVDPVEYDVGDALPIDPYLMGLLLGDGSFRGNGQGSGGVSLAVAAVDADETQGRIVLPSGVAITRRDRGGWSEFYFAKKTDRTPRVSNPFTDMIRSLGLFDVKGGDKFIPDSYLHASMKERVALLQGLVDSDGNIGTTATRYTTTSHQLASDLGELVGSLGGVTTVQLNKGRSTLTVQIRQLPNWITPARLTRKVAQHRTRSRRTRTMTNAKFMRSEPTRCIRIDSDDHLYVTDNFVITHNTPNMLVTLQKTLSPPQREVWRDMLESAFGGTGNAWKTMILEEGADAKIIGQAVTLGFTDVQAGGENRIAVAAGVPSVVLGIKEGAEQATYNNYQSALSHMANFTTQHMWNDTVNVLTNGAPVPAGEKLIIDTSEIPALQQDGQDAATITETQGRTIRDLKDGGFTAESVIDAVTSNDLTLLEHVAEEVDPSSNGQVGDPEVLAFLSE